MLPEVRSQIRRGLRRLAGLAVLLGAGLALFLRTDPARRSDPAAWGLLTAAGLLCGVMVHGRIRRSLRAQRSERLEAAARGTSRSDLVPVELHRIIAEVEGARGSREQYAEGLGVRLAGLADRRAGLTAPPSRLRTAGRAAGGAEAPGKGGMSLGEISASIARIEEE